MSNLVTYNGNFLNFADNEFSFRGRTTKQFNQRIDMLDITASCPVGVFPSQNGETVIEIDTDAPEEFNFFQSGSTVVVEQTFKSGSVYINGTTIISGNDVVMVNGEVCVDGRKINPSQPQKSSYPHKIRIYSPSHISLEASLRGASILASKVVFKDASVSISGVATIGLAAKSLDLDLSGQGENYAVIKGGRLSVDLSGQGKVRIKGEYSDISASVSGMGSILTEGTCTGNYKASVSGMGKVRHYGSVMGRIKESKSGMGSIDIQQ